MVVPWPIGAGSLYVCSLSLSHLGQSSRILGHSGISGTFE